MMRGVGVVILNHFSDWAGREGGKVIFFYIQFAAVFLNLSFKSR